MLRLLLVSALAAAVGAFRITPSAVAGIVPGSNPDISGTIIFTRSPFGVIISGTVTGLAPGLHGFHVHETGNTADGCRAAGGHFNPLMRTHGSPKDFNRHAGDLGNIVADEYGRAAIYFLDKHISLDPQSQTFIGNLAVVLHAGEDDLGRGGDEGSLSTGNAGGREGCGLIHVVENVYQARNSYQASRGPAPRARYQEIPHFTGF